MINIYARSIAWAGLENGVDWLVGPRLSTCVRSCMLWFHSNTSDNIWSIHSSHSGGAECTHKHTNTRTHEPQTASSQTAWRVLNTATNALAHAHAYGMQKMKLLACMCCILCAHALHWNQCTAQTAGVSVVVVAIVVVVVAAADWPAFYLWQLIKIASHLFIELENAVSRLSPHARVVRLPDAFGSRRSDRSPRFIGRHRTTRQHPCLRGSAAHCTALSVITAALRSAENAMRKRAPGHKTYAAVVTEYIIIINVRRRRRRQRN